MPVRADYQAPLPEEGVSGGSWFLVYDNQYDVRTDGADLYHHSAVKITSSGGLDDYSQINIEVDPTYQRLDIHAVKVIRDGHVTDELPSARITALPQETELRNRVYNGGYNINVLLSDVRIGDIVEYEYTIRSRERIFPGLFSAHMPIGWGVPVHWQRVRVLAPASRELFFRATDAQRVPPATLHDNIREFEWIWHDLPSLQADADRPKWYQVWPDLLVTSSRDWAEVARQVTPLFVVSEPPSSELRTVVEDIRKAGGTQAEQALRALQFVQEQIRYVSISIGRGAFRPSSPNTVLGRRFGDCKDKSLLLVTILRQLGIEAQAALVNARTGRVLDRALPDPYLFNHAIVRLRVGEQTFWVDGTAEKQLSPLSVDTPASFGWALVVDDSTSGLTNIPRPAATASGKKSEVLIDMSAGMNKPAKLQIMTSYLGWWADSEREDLADDSPRARQSSYVNYIAEYYPGAKTSAPIAVSDDKIHNVVKVTESYELPKTFAASNGHQRFFVQVDELYRYAGNLKSSVRTSPLAIAYPADVQQTIRVILPQKWPMQDETVKIDNPAFHYVSTVNYADKGRFAELLLDYKYRSLTDVVEPAALAQYQADRKRLDQDLGYYIGPPDKPTPRVTTAMFKRLTLAPTPKWLMLLTLAFGLYLALRYGYRWDPEPRPAQADWPSGLSGWLIAIILVVLITPIGWAAILWWWAGSFDIEKWSHLSELVPEPFKSGAQAGLLVVVGGGVLLMVGFLLSAILFFSRRSSAPPVFIAVHWLSFSWSIAAQLYLSACHLAAHTTLGQRLWGSRYDVVCLVLYTAYLVQSKRVKATFVERRLQHAKVAQVGNVLVDQV
jgi:transglutaminase-like putative cysteine protease